MKQLFKVEYEGQTFTRRSARPYTHAAIWHGGENGRYATFHESAAGAARLVYGRLPVAVVEVSAA